MRLLVTNDDGVFAPGIGSLATALVEAGHDVVVAAPADDRSGAGAAIGGIHADETIAFEQIDLDGLDGATCHSVVASPALIVIAACLGAFGPAPEMVVSGINAGANTGRAVLHSGTVGAALTAANFACSGLAVSLAAGGASRWSTAADLAVAALEWLASEPAGGVVNLNVPNREAGELLGVRNATLASFGTVRASIVEAPGGLQVALGAGDDDELGTGDDEGPDTDTALLLAGYATLTSLSGIRALERPEAAAAVERRLPARTG
jgi:5'-nucleotidase